MVVRGIVFVATALVVSLGVVALAQYESTTRARSPKLTTEDVPAAGPCAAAMAGPIVWQHSLDRALEQASANNGLVIIDVYTDWCGWCKRMDKDIYEAPVVVALGRRDVFLKFNAEDGGEGQRFANKM